ncbi:MAG: hypothetical protein OEV38_20360 [Nitrospira sp.]|nr:hypothetical protein [Nitrospira sp.]MDH4358018.1 hypothetical protein [Nitrospira sp.]MDH5320451.1 hypothetical protein [Nitrospira sp.]
MLPLEDFRTKLLAQRRELFPSPLMPFETKRMRADYGIPLRKGLPAR